MDFDVEERIRVLKELRQVFEDFQNGAKVWGYQYQKDVGRMVEAF